jgi:small GTP-binding protein
MKVIQKKVCMLGSFAVGKTSLVRRFVEGRFDDRYLSTIGVKISRRTVELPQLHVNLILWDLAGGDEFLRSNTGYLRGAAAGILVCDVTRPDTTTLLTDYANQLRSLNGNAELVILANKADLTEERLLSDEFLVDLGRKLQAPVRLTSALTGLNVADAFSDLANRLS